MPITIQSAQNCFDQLAQDILAEIDKAHVDIIEAANLSPSMKVQLTITVPIEFTPKSHQFTISSVTTPVMPCYRRKVTRQGEDKDQIALALKITGTDIVPPEGEPIDTEDPETSEAPTSVSPIAGAQEVRKADAGKKPRGRPKKVQPTETPSMEPTSATLASIVAKQEADPTADSVWPAEPFKDSFAATVPPFVGEDGPPPED